MDRNTFVAQHYSENYDRLCKSISRLAGGYENAEDVVQETYVRVLKYFSSWTRGKGEFSRWFNTIMNNTLKDFMRAERNSGMGLDVEDEGFEGGDREFISKESADIVKRAIASKPAPTAFVLRLYYLRDYTPKEISQLVTMPHKTIRQYIWRFRKEMEEKLGANSI